MNANTITKPKLPKTLLEAVRYFSDLDVCVEYVAQLRWHGEPVCGRCGGTAHSYLKTRRVWKCRACKYQFSVKKGTIFEDSPIGLDKWLPAVWLLANSKNGVSSHELARSIGITQKSAWFVLHRARHAMATGSFDRMRGEVEVDETFIGGKAGNQHKSKRIKYVKEGLPYTSGKAIVIGAKNRETGTIDAEVVSNRQPVTVQGFIGRTVQANSTVYTDAWKAYRRLDRIGMIHQYVDHTETYVEGRVHTNGVENFWALLKRGLHGTYVQVDPVHLMRYVDERVFTYNLRNLNDLERFETVLTRAIGRRITWDELTNA